MIHFKNVQKVVEDYELWRKIMMWLKDPEIKMMCQLSFDVKERTNFVLETRFIAEWKDKIEMKYIAQT